MILWPQLMIDGCSQLLRTTVAIETASRHVKQVHHAGRVPLLLQQRGQHAQHTIRYWLTREDRTFDMVMTFLPRSLRVLD